MTKIFTTFIVGIVVIVAMILIVGIGSDKNSIQPIETGSSSASSSSSANTPKLTLATFDQIKIGQTLPEVETIIGKGDLTSEMEIAGYTSLTYTFKGESFVSSAILSFQEGKLSTKTQYGLK